MTASCSRNALPYAVVVSLAIVGCMMMPQPDPGSQADKLIAEKVAEASEAQAEYSALLAEKHQQTLRKQAKLETDVIDVDWIGSPNEFLQMMADRYGYRYIEAGARTKLRTVNVFTRKSPAIEVLRDVATQIGRSADVHLEMEKKVIRLVYKTN
ncbi:MAG: DotD/TraH family lipoprotein [Betaproteobacteria bacterium]|nr:DotD/TraH family lipoprotein [Betaproteobacteria bacterium]